MVIKVFIIPFEEVVVEGDCSDGAGFDRWLGLIIGWMNFLGGNTACGDNRNMIKIVGSVQGFISIRYFRDKVPPLEVISVKIY